MKPGKIVSRRETDVQAPGEIGRPLAGLAYVLTIPAGAILTGAGLVLHRRRWLIVGGGLFGLWGVQHFFARRGRGSRRAVHEKPAILRPVR